MDESGSRDASLEEGIRSTGNKSPFLKLHWNCHELLVRCNIKKLFAVGAPSGLRTPGVGNLFFPAMSGDRLNENVPGIIRIGKPISIGRDLTF